MSRFGITKQEGASFAHRTSFVGLFEGIPPLITVDAPDASCRAVGGEAQVYAATAGTVVITCLRGPDLLAHEAEVPARKWMLPGRPPQTRIS